MPWILRPPWPSPLTRGGLGNAGADEGVGVGLGVGEGVCVGEGVGVGFDAVVAQVQSLQPLPEVPSACPVPPCSGIIDMQGVAEGGV